MKPDSSRDRLIRALLIGVACLFATLIEALAQSWHQEPGYRFMELKVPAGSKPGFTLMTPQETGIWFTNRLPESRSLTNTILPNGSGVAAGDVDGDGLCDLFFAGLGGSSRLYRNLGNWRFEDVTDASGINCSNLDATGVTFVDLDGTGHLDLIVNSIGGGTHVFLNDGAGHFRPGPVVLNPGGGGTSLALADAEGHGTLDLYIANYRASTILDMPGTRFSMKMVNNRPEVASINGRPLTDPEWTNRFAFKTAMDSQGRGRLAREELGEADVFYRNRGHGRFEEVPWTGGVFLDEEGHPLAAPPFDWGLSVMFRDFNGDGAPDLYICNDFNTPDRFWLNDGQGHFRAAPRMTLRETSFSSMGIDVADLNRDGYDEFFVVDMLSRDHVRQLTQRNSAHSEMESIAGNVDRPQYTRNTLFLNRGDGTYAEIAQYAGLDATEWSWAPVFLDVDLDGYEDLLVPNGFVRDNMNLDIQNRIKQTVAAQKLSGVEALRLRKLFPPLATGNLAFHNAGDLRFEDTSKLWGFNSPVISQGTCLADLDNDGDLDVVVNNLNDAAGIYRNNASAARIAVRLKGRAPNSRGIGARIVVFGGPVVQSQVMICGGRYLSADDAMRVFAAGSLTNRLQIEVSWRSGPRSVISNALPDCLYEIDESGARPFVAPAVPETRPLFEDRSQVLSHSHHDDSFDDTQRQPLLPRRLSQLGPGICWWDIDGDGLDDLIIGSGKDGQLACYHNNSNGGFSRMEQGTWTNTVARDQASVIGWSADSVLVATANYEDEAVQGSSVQLFSATQGKPGELAPASDSSPGPLAAADYDGAGELGLFVGGRVKPGKYPLAADSFLYHQERGKLVVDETNTAQLRHLGLVSGAVWTDLDGDGYPELLLACDWGPIRIFRNHNGKLTPWDPDIAFPSGLKQPSPVPGQTKPAALSQLTGFWNGIATGDFDGDGRMDFVASNWGENTKYERHRNQSLRLYYGDYQGDGNIGLFESWFEPAFGKYVPICGLEAAIKQIPSLIARFPTHQAWAEADMASVLGSTSAQTQFLEATWLETTLFLNRGDHFEARPLPFEAQLAPAFGICVADFDGNGAEDIFLGQNFFDVDANTSRYDAGRGLLLSGDGHGGLHAVPGQTSGIRVYGELRGTAVCDYDGDGRVDLVVTQNGGETKLFHNAMGASGLRVRLSGSSRNPKGIGAMMRLKFGERFGPAREVHAGGGYWSQDSVVQVLGTPAAPTGLWVRWPGGKTTTYPLTGNAAEIEAGIDGTIRVLASRK
ncbi:MAG TPA: FG-GAP-like repeat-containing protein [Verrucomicrobiae bacterium]|nr:FG-GAP-like repeat-containing protein [Verrucomicrobiae bacterium]